MDLSGGRNRASKVKGVALAALAVVAVAGVAREGTASNATATPSDDTVPAVYASVPVSVYPSPGDRYETPQTQITFRGIPSAAITGLSVTGSKSGVHTGTIQADSDGDGGSFVPDKPFTPGETVTVATTNNIVGGKNGTWTFQVEHPGTILPPETPPDATGPNDIQTFHSRPDLQPASLQVKTASEPASDGDFFLAPQFGPTQNGPMILDPRGNVVWFLPIPISRKTLVTDFRVQQLNGQQVLTWWQGSTNNGSGRGQGVIFNQNYQQIATVQAGNGLQMDLHEFLVTDNGDAYVLAVSPVQVPGYVRSVENAVVQEIDIKTGLVLFQWDALDHIGLNDSYTFSPKESGQVLDPYHANSVSLDASGNIVLSVRNTSAIYDINRATGKIIWELGGKHSTFKLGSGVSTAFQHDAVMHAGNTLTIFDDGAGPPKVHTYSRGIDVALNLTKKTATLLSQYNHSPGLSAAFEGSVQQLPSGDVLLGWGQQPYISEVNAKGQTDFDAKFTVATATYRAYRFPWVAQPPTTPALAVGETNGGTTTLWESWNGATDVSGWRVMAGPTASKLAPIARYAKNRFESTLTPGLGDNYVAVQALGTTGQVLATTATKAVPNHTQVFGSSAFVSPSALGGLPVGCFSTKACHISAELTSGNTVLAKTGSQYYTPDSGGLLYFRLSPSAHAALAASGSNRMSAQVAIRDSSGAASAYKTVNLIGFTSTGAGPHRSFAQGSVLRFRSGTEFVAPNGTGAALVACVSDTPCQVKTSLSAGRAMIASTGNEYIGANQLGYVYFTLSAAGQNALDHAAGNQLGATMTLSGAGSNATGRVALVRFS